MAGMRNGASLAMFLMLPLIVYVPIDVSLKEDTWLGSIWEVNASERKETKYTTYTNKSGHDFVYGRHFWSSSHTRAKGLESTKYALGNGVFFGFLCAVLWW